MSMRRASTHCPVAESRVPRILGASRSAAGYKRTPSSVCGLRCFFLARTANRAATLNTCEYLPGEFAWRGVEAGGSMFIHCVWIFSKQHQRKGWGRIMVEGCLEDARKAGLSGAAVMVRDGPILPTAACSWRTVSNGCAAGLPIACSEVR
jgi:hypothetical protein